MASPFVPVVSCAAVGPLVAVVLSATNVHGVPVVDRVSSPVSLLDAMDVTAVASDLSVVNCLLLLVFPPVFDVLSPLLFLPWIPCYD